MLLKSLKTNSRGWRHISVAEHVIRLIKKLLALVHNTMGKHKQTQPPPKSNVKNKQVKLYFLGVYY